MLKWMAAAKELYSELTGMNYMVNKYKDIDEMKSNIDKEKAAVKVMEKTLYLWRTFRLGIKR